MGEADLGLVPLLGDLEDDVRAVPLALVLDEVEARVRDVPDDPLARYQLGDLLGCAVRGSGVRHPATGLLDFGFGEAGPPSQLGGELDAER